MSNVDQGHDFIQLTPDDSSPGSTLEIDSPQDIYHGPHMDMFRTLGKSLKQLSRRELLRIALFAVTSYIGYGIIRSVSSTSRHSTVTEQAMPDANPLPLTKDLSDANLFASIGNLTTIPPWAGSYPPITDKNGTPIAVSSIDIVGISPNQVDKSSAVRKGVIQTAGTLYNVSSDTSNQTFSIEGDQGVQFIILVKSGLLADGKKLYARTNGFPAQMEILDSRRETPGYYTLLVTADKQTLQMAKQPAVSGTSTPDLSTGQSYPLVCQFFAA